MRNSKRRKMTLRVGTHRKRWRRSTLLKNNGTFPEETSVLLEMSLILMECSIVKTGLCCDTVINNLNTCTIPSMFKIGFYCPEEEVSSFFSWPWDKKCWSDVPITQKQFCQLWVFRSALLGVDRNKQTPNCSLYLPDSSSLTRRTVRSQWRSAS